MNDRPEEPDPSREPDPYSEQEENGELLSKTKRKATPTLIGPARRARKVDKEHPKENPRSLVTTTK
eukprot:4240035-Prorocentrum_lima.AAC.1